MIKELLSSQEKRDKFLAYSLIPIVVFFLSHTFLNDFLSQKNDELLEQKSILESQLEIKKSYLDSIIDDNLNKTIQNYSINILNIEQDIKSVVTVKNRLIENIKSLNNQSLKWVSLVEILVKESNTLSVELYSIKNLETQSSVSSIKEKLNIEVNGMGNFQNIYSFINTLENSNPMVMVDNLTISKGNLKGDLEFKFNVKVWEFTI
jgi:hypothetical protein